MKTADKGSASGTGLQGRRQLIRSPGPGRVSAPELQHRQLVALPLVTDTHKHHYRADHLPPCNAPKGKGSGKQRQTHRHPLGWDLPSPATWGVCVPGDRGSRLRALWLGVRFRAVPGPSPRVRGSLGRAPVPCGQPWLVLRKHSGVGSKEVLAPSQERTRQRLQSKTLPSVEEELGQEITEVCGAKRVGYFGPAQFYIALKLIAAAQSGLPVRIESIKNELPLPRFVALKNDSEVRYGTPAEPHGVKFQVPHATLEKNSYKRTDEGDKQEPKSPSMSPICSPPASPSTYQRIPLSYGYGKSRSGPEQQHGAPYEVRHSTHQQDGQSSGNYGAKPAVTCSILNRSLSAEREQQDSSTHYSDDPWRITEEQRDYYINQFRSLQPDLNSFISGSVAKNFFTKSKLPIPELSHIWELSDVDCDGALTLPEFCAAFHLVVARKNGYQLPETLPETLLPEYLQAASLKPIHDCALFDSYSELLPGGQQTRDFSRTEKASAEEVPDNSALLQDSKKDDKQALKVSTVLKTIPKEFQHLTVKTAAQESYALKARPRSRSYSSTSIEDAMKKGEEPPTPPPRPQKSHSRASSLDLNKIFQQNTQAVRSGWLPPPPPALPPRPSVSQTEPVSEVELHPQMNRPPSQAEESSSAKKEVVLAQPPSKPARRKLRTETQGLETPEHSPTISVTSSLPVVKPHLPVQKQSSKQKRAIQTAIRKNKEANAVLARLNSELQQQLKEVHKERIALETQLEQLRPVTVL
ncbi:PREDICTED: ralBP1-associated Eps domain-containing protein 2 [Chaetura pelagica]|uniref:ralBP1-associated Eps domain-containing protein 2 n=1 Tax=Chaetura pelagica TaxID=8897 RepID=UPI0005231056|nr:PREDICTED: ralBP1-associated Eps domain-containing protein 2 [Chaetura pelagica]